MKAIFCIVIVVSMVIPCSAVTICVDVGAGGANNGSSWVDAFVELQSGLGAAVADDEIWVAAGTYKPSVEVDGTGDRYKTFQMKNNVAIYGGFAGTETLLSQRDAQNNETILSGEIGIVDDPNDNCYHVFYHPDGTGLDNTAVLDGFTITRGNANSEIPYYFGGGERPYYFGGGMYNEDSSPTVRNCIFIGNQAKNGGGMYNSNLSGSLTTVVTNCTFTDNQASEDGGGIYNPGDMTITKCTFSSNSAISGSGGGMCNHEGSSTITDSTFSDNWAQHHGGGMRNEYNSPMAIVNCAFIGNSASISGGGMNNYFSVSTVTNSTFGGNIASVGGGISNDGVYCGNLILNNCIIWGNTGLLDGNEIASEYSSTIDVDYCDVEGGLAAIYDDGSENIINWGGGNIDVDPEFVDPNGVDGVIGTRDDNFRLMPGSPCIDEANNVYVPTGVTTDLDGRIRIADGDCDETATVDMGAYEESAWLYAGDFAGGCDIDMGDFAVLVESWQAVNESIDIVPFLEPDGVIDIGELMVLAENWLDGGI